VWSVTYNHNHGFIVLATVNTIINYDRKTFIVLATVNTIINYDRKTFIVQATGRVTNNYFTVIMNFVAF
jgi:hypothetical protein